MTSRRSIAPRSAAMLWMAITWRALHEPDAEPSDTLAPYLPLVDRHQLTPHVQPDDERLAAALAAAETTWRATRGTRSDYCHADRAAGDMR